MKKMMIAVATNGAVMSLASCSGKEEPDAPSTITNTTDTEMTVSGVWKSGTEIHLDRHLVIPEGESLTIEPGVSVIVSADGVGVNHVPIEIVVRGNLYCLGTEENPVLFSVEESLRTPSNIFAGLWGGIVAEETCSEMVIDHAVIEYTGGQVIEGSPAESEVYIQPVMTHIRRSPLQTPPESM